MTIVSHKLTRPFLPPHPVSKRLVSIAIDLQDALVSWLEGVEKDFDVLRVDGSAQKLAE